MAEQQNSPFARVSNGYDPKQVAAFAAEALSWKKELVALQSEVAAAGKIIGRYESVIGDIEAVEREAAEFVEDAEREAAGLIEDAEVRAAKIVEEAENEAARILEMAQDQLGATPVAEPVEPEPKDGDGWLTPEPTPDETPDPVDQIFEPVEELGLVATDPAMEQRIAAAANLWKRRGVIAPSE